MHPCHGGNGIWIWEEGSLGAARKAHRKSNAPQNSDCAFNDEQPLVTMQPGFAFQVLQSTGNGPANDLGDREGCQCQRVRQGQLGLVEKERQVVEDGRESSCIENRQDLSLRLIRGYFGQKIWQIKDMECISEWQLGSLWVGGRCLPDSKIPSKKRMA